MKPPEPAAVDATTERLNFDSDMVPRDAGFERYRDLYGQGADVVRAGPSMHARVRAWRLDRMLLYDRRLNDVGHRRDARRVENDGFDHFTATLLLVGEMSVTIGGATHDVRPGEVILVSTGIPGENRMSRAHVVTISIARDWMATITSDVDALHGTTLAADKVQLFREFVESLLRNLPTMSRDATMAAAGVLMTLLMIAIDNAGLDRRGGQSRDLERLADLRRLIDTHLSNPDVDAADIVRRSGLSRATLYRLLAAYGGIATFLRDRRLEYLRRRLGDRADTRPITALIEDAGFASASHASRAFLARYAIRPSEYRDVVNAQSGGDAYLAMRLWHAEVR